jgi:alpha-glucosidase
MPRPAPTTIIGPKVEKPSDRAWWKSATVYQIYPVRCFGWGGSQ